MAIKVTQDLLDKNTPADNDKLVISDSTDLENTNPESGKLKRLSWANLKTTLKTYFDTLYPSGSGISTGTNTGDETAGTIKTKYESNADTNAFTDAEKAKVGNVPTNTNNELDGKQETLVSGTNIKTINGNTLLDAGDLEVPGGAGGTPLNVYFTTLASTTVGTYKQISYTPEVAETIVTAIANNNEVLLEEYIFDGDVGVNTIQSGEWEFVLNGNIDNTAQTSLVRIEVFSRTSGGVETTLFSKSSQDINNTTRERIVLFSTQPSFSINTTDRIGVRVYFSTTRTSDTTLSLAVGNGDASFLISPLPTRHNLLRARDEANSHPISAITGLQAGLDSKQDILSEGAFIDGDKTKLDGIEEGAEVNEVTLVGIETLTNKTVNGVVLTNAGDGSSYLADDGTYKTVSSGGGAVSVLNTFTQAGTIVSGTYGTWDSGQTGTISEVNASYQIAPTGTSATVEVFKNGLSIGTITIVGGSGATTTFSDTTLSKFDTISYVVTEGGTIAGSGISINFIVS